MIYDIKCFFEKIFRNVYFEFTISLMLFIVDTEIWEVENEKRKNDFRFFFSMLFLAFLATKNNYLPDFDTNNMSPANLEC